MFVCLFRNSTQNPLINWNYRKYNKLCHWKAWAQELSENILRRLPDYRAISKKNVLKNCFSTISRISHNISGAKISVLGTGFRICNSFCTLFLWFCFHRADCLKQAKKIEVFSLSPFWNLNFEIWKVNSLQKFWSFWDMIWQDVSFLSLENQYLTHWWSSYHATLVIYRTLSAIWFWISL